MILVDTSVWVDHLRTGDVHLRDALERSQVAVHPFVVGELACGHLRNRAAVLGLLQQLPHVLPAREEEVLYYIDQHKLMGRGLGYIDVHLLVAVALAEHTVLWTRDQRLAAVARGLGLDYHP